MIYLIYLSDLDDDLPDLCDLDHNLSDMSDLDHDPSDLSVRSRWWSIWSIRPTGESIETRHTRAALYPPYLVPGSILVANIKNDHILPLIGTPTSLARHDFCPNHSEWIDGCHEMCVCARGAWCRPYHTPACCAFTLLLSRWYSMLLQV